MPETSPDSSPRLIGLAQRLASRLERLSVDSRWARRASGLRGNLLKALEDAESGRPAPGLELLVIRGYELLSKAAGEIVVPE
jgi:hypothetical protein